MITPTLFVGEPADLPYFGDLCLAEAPDEAVEQIDIGKSALLLREADWISVAQKVLSILGMTTPEADRLIHSARTVNELPASLVEW